MIVPYFDYDFDFRLNRSIVLLYYPARYVRANTVPKIVYALYT